MKKIWLMAFVFFKVLSFSCGVEKSSSVKKIKKIDVIPKIDFYTSIPMELKNETEFRINDVIFGGKIIFPFCELRYSVQGDNYSKGTSFYTWNLYKKVPFAVKAGNLSLGGLLSKLNNPVLSSSVSPFSLLSTEVSGFTANLSGYSVFSNPDSIFFQTGFGGKTIRSLGVNMIFTPEKRLCFSGIGRFEFPKKIRAGFSIGIGFFNYDEKSSSSWFIDAPYYRSGNHFSGTAQFSFSKKWFSNLTSLSLYQNPFGVYEWTVKNEGKISGQNLTGAAAFFINQNKALMTSSERRINQCVQVKLSLLYKNRAKIGIPWLYTAGLSGYSQINYEDDSHDLKIGAGVRFNSGICLLSLSGQINNKLKGQIYWKNEKIIFPGKLEIQNDSFSVTAKTNLYIGKVNPAVTGVFSFTPAEELDSITTTQKITLCLTPVSKPVINLNASTTFYQKDGSFQKWTSSMWIQMNYVYRKISITAKVSFKILE